jgi:hypothetical protein
VINGKSKCVRGTKVLEDFLQPRSLGSRAIIDIGVQRDEHAVTNKVVVGLRDVMGVTTVEALMNEVRGVEHSLSQSLVEPTSLVVATRKAKKGVSEMAESQTYNAPSYPIAAIIGT